MSKPIKCDVTVIYHTKDGTYSDDVKCEEEASAKTIQIGSIYIEDKNQNDIFDPQVDQIKNYENNNLLPDSQEVKKVMGELGIKSLRGLSLSSAGMFMDFFDFAERMALKGRPNEVQPALEKAREFSKRASRPFDQKRAEKILKTAATNAPKASAEDAETCFKKAETLAKWGDKEGMYFDFGQLGRDPVEKVRKELARAREYAQGAGMQFDEVRAEKIQKQAFEGGIAIAFQSAEVLAEQSDFIRSDKEIFKITQYAEEAKIKLDYDRINAIQEYSRMQMRGIKPMSLESLFDSSSWEYYQRPDGLLQKAKIAAYRGDVSETNYFITAALKYPHSNLKAVEAIFIGTIAVIKYLQQTERAAKSQYNLTTTDKPINDAPKLDEKKPRLDWGLFGVTPGGQFKQGLENSFPRFGFNGEWHFSPRLHYQYPGLKNH